MVKQQISSLKVQKEIAKRAIYHLRKVGNHGYQPIPASMVYQSFEELAQPEQIGFSKVKTGLYGKSINEYLVQLIKLQALKGKSYTIWWGISLSYLPHQWTERLEWHRSFKASRFDLFETPTDYFPQLIKNWRQAEDYVTDTLHGPIYFQDTLHIMWKQLSPEVLAWFSTMHSLEDVLAKAQEQVNRKWIGLYHHPNPLMVYAFTHARLGHTEEAQAALEKYSQLSLESSSAKANLNKALLALCADQLVQS
jgi:hypothetical protein